MLPWKNCYEGLSDSIVPKRGTEASFLAYFDSIVPKRGTEEALCH